MTQKEVESILGKSPDVDTDILCMEGHLGWYGKSAKITVCFSDNHVVWAAEQPEDRRRKSTISKFFEWLASLAD
jgi:hypothetical protein